MRPLAQVLLALLVLAASSLLARHWVVSREAVVPEETPIPLPIVSVVTARPEWVALEVTTHGTARALETATLTSEVSGRVLDLHPQLIVGGRVTAGEVLVRIEQVQLEEARATASAGVAKAQLDLALEERQAEVAEREWKGAGRGEPDDLVLRVPQLARAHAELEAARARLVRAERDLSRSEVRAPFDARVREEFLAPGDHVTAGMHLATLLRVDALEVVLPVSDVQLEQLEPRSWTGLLSGAPGSEAEVELHARLGGQTRTWSGQVVRAEGEVDPRSRMVHLVARVDALHPPTASNGTTPNPGNGAHAEEPPVPLLPGLFLTARIRGREVNAIRLPRAALGGPERVLVVDAEERLRFRQVRICWQGQDEVLVEGGLEAGERVCVSPLAAPVDGMRVRVED